MARLLEISQYERDVRSERISFQWKNIGFSVLCIDLLSAIVGLRVMEGQCSFDMQESVEADVLKPVRLSESR